MQGSSKLSIIYLFKTGRRERLQLIKDVPSEFFYGFTEFVKEGYDVNLFEEKDLNIYLKNLMLRRLFNLIGKLIFNLPLNAIFGLILNKGYKKLNGADYIIATTNTLGIAVSFAKNLGFIKSKILFINMGLFRAKPSQLKLYLYRYLFKKIKLLTISKTEYEFLKLLFNKYKIHYIPFGVDASFWLPKSKQECKPFVLAIGNDLARDWNTLVNSWEDNFPTLKIITSLPVNTKKNNIVVLKGSWHSQLLSDSEIRNLYRDSEFVILPLKETFQPSGQSTCLQAMGCSKAVIISNINGIWDRKLLKNKENILLVEPENIKDLNYAIKLLLKNKKLRKTLEENGRKLIQDHFNIFIMKNNLQSIFEEN